MELTRFFHDYAAAFNRSLGPSVDAQAIMAAFADCFVEASPAGVRCGHNGDDFRAALQTGYAFYKSIGTRRMSVSGIDSTDIDDLHATATVHWVADYEKTDGSLVTIHFNVTYLVQQLSGGAPKIFAFIAGDEMAALRQQGLV